MRHERKRILCAGIVVLDELFRVKDFPPPDGKVEATEFMAIGGGNAANAAITIARLGGQASYAGPVGDDMAGDRILANLAREGVDTSGHIRVPGTSSPLSAIFVNARGERSIVTHRGAQLSAALPLNGVELVAHVDGVLIDNRMAAFARPVGEAALARGIPVVLDADKATTPDDPLLSTATHVIFSSECLRQTVGSDDLAAAVARLARATGRFVATTNGPGDVIWSEGGKVVSDAGVQDHRGRQPRGRRRVSRCVRAGPGRRPPDRGRAAVRCRHGRPQVHPLRRQCHSSDARRGRGIFAELRLAQVSSCPRLSPAPSEGGSRSANNDVDGRDKPGQ